MRTAVVALFITTAVVFVLSAARNLRTSPGESDTATKQLLGLRLRLPLYRTIGSLELAAVTGLLAGLVVLPLGIAAAAGLTLLMIGAIIYHLRAGDPATALLYPAAPLALSTAALIVGLAAL